MQKGGKGLDKIQRELQNVNFPATKSDLMNRIGDREVPVGNRNMRMNDVINRVPRDRFESQDELLREIESNVPELGR